MMTAKDYEEAKAQGYTEQQIRASVTTVCCYCTYIMLHVMEQAVNTSLTALTKIPEVNNGIRGAKKEMNAVRAALQNASNLRNYIAAEYRERIEIICREQYDYVDRTITQMQLSVLNFFLKHKVNGAQAMSYSCVAQMISNMAIATIQLRAQELQSVHRYTTSRVAEFLKPKAVEKRCHELTQRIARIYGNEENGSFKLTDCQGLTDGIRIIDKMVTDVDLIEMHTAFALEETRGADYLRDHCPTAYYALHPNQDPERIEAKRKREEQEAREAQQRKEAMEQAEWQESHLDEYAMSQLSDRFKVSKA